MIDYAKIRVGDKLRITGEGAPGFADLGDIVTVTQTNGHNKLSVVHPVSKREVFFALTCGAMRLEVLEELYDVIEVNIYSHVVKLMGQGKTLKNAEAIEKMAIHRRMGDDNFFVIVHANTYVDGDLYNELP